MLQVRRRKNVTGQFANMRALPVGHETSGCHMCVVRCRIICAKRSGDVHRLSGRQNFARCVAVVRGLQTRNETGRCDLCCMRRRAVCVGGFAGLQRLRAGKVWNTNQRCVCRMFGRKVQRCHQSHGHKYVHCMRRREIQQRAGRHKRSPVQRVPGRDV